MKIKQEFKEFDPDEHTRKFAEAFDHSMSVNKDRS